MANTTKKTNKKKSSGTKPKADNTKKVTVQEAKPVVPSYEKCGVYWCRFFGGMCCMLREGDSMKKIVCIKEEGEKFFKSPRPKSRFAVD